MGIRQAVILLWLVILFQPLHSQPFDHWFDDGVMRVDLVFTGTAGESSYAFSGIRKEPYYSGSRTQLIDTFDYGNHKLTVKDAASGQLLFSHTYCTLFNEWQTTDEAATLVRAFNHVIRFPWPKEPVVVEIYDRNDKGKFIMQWSEELDPGTIFADRGNPQLFMPVDLMINGPPEEKVDILFLAEGYRERELGKFIRDARRSMEYIFEEEPFKGNREAFNVRAVKSASMDTGTDIPGHGIWKNTVMNSSFYTFGIERYMTTLDYRSVCDVASNAHYDQIYILVNTDKYGGGGMYNLYAISAADNENSRNVVVHEFGHAFGGLGDEYFSSEVAYNEFYNLKVEPWEPNLTTLVDFDRKWKGMLHDTTPVPTPPEEAYSETVGVYEGGGYVDRGVYRPMIDCLMRNNEAGFCPVCCRSIEQMIRRHTGQ